MTQPMNMKKKPKFLRNFLLATGGILGAIWIINGVHYIDAGMRGVVFGINGYSDELPSGIRFVANPLAKVTEYPISTQTVYLNKSKDQDNAITVNTDGGKEVKVNVNYSYHMDESQLKKVFINFSKNRDVEYIEYTWIRSQIKNAMNQVVPNYSILDIQSKQRAEVNTKVSEILTKLLAEKGIVLESFTMEDIVVDANTMKKLQAIQDAQNENEKLRLEKENVLIENEIARKKAENAAQVKQIEAEAQAKANKTKEASLTPEIIQMEIVNKWNGQLPTVQGNGSAIIQLPPVEGKK